MTVQTLVLSLINYGMAVRGSTNKTLLIKENTKIAEPRW